MENIWIASWKHCDWVGKIDLVVLFLLSIYSWAIMIDKFILIKRVRRANEKFVSNFYNGKMLNVPGSPWSRILSRILQEKTRQNLSEENALTLLKKFANEEISYLNNKIDFLLSISAVAPFMGLLGTVWGILMAFHNIGQTGTSSVSIIASGISEALIVTFVGLLVAIPAALGYNYLNGQVRNIQTQGNYILESFYTAIK
ncbi:MAG TPA: MotA/TolQ/ExbB proton channel family protein [bacterium]|nr:MotA/TolQ/ExbB proton channel family protein [bacterium]HOL34322.1 MotA/TolQ/ExbB proton channel family protein [bacterium]HPP08016.1 MotA/TolQ/ExbB proton channel family protein [bacterium]